MNKLLFLYIILYQHYYYQFGAFGFDCSDVSRIFHHSFSIKLYVSELRCGELNCVVILHCCQQNKFSFAWKIKIINSHFVFAREMRNNRSNNYSEKNWMSSAMHDITGYISIHSIGTRVFFFYFRLKLIDIIRIRFDKLHFKPILMKIYEMIIFRLMFQTIKHIWIIYACLG